MVVESRHLIEPSDVISVEFSCPKCDARILHRLEGFSRVPLRCPNCHEDLIQPEGPEYVAIEDAVNALRRLREGQKAAKIRFEIKDGTLAPAS
jgi:predicted RNA-binding Zn-ribbon protein involved in translation (DUF1610 family)